ncbi:hypothetical protein B0O99DRAFT_685569 [Bisporella sp. PMI_857]|nr:hypothetical protein B0O99DRAFT_685569 [Bisporella sp. PMI_857]
MKFTSTALLAVLATLASAAPATEKAEFVSDFKNSSVVPEGAIAVLQAGLLSAPGTSNVPAKGSSEKRAITHLFVAADVNFGGRTENLATNTGQCNDLLNGWNNIVSSLGPDAGTTCCIYEYEPPISAIPNPPALLKITNNKINSNTGCGGASLCGIINPGIFNLVDFGWNDRASSYRCN